MKSTDMSIVRDNLMSEKYYTPYCGDGESCSMPRTIFNGLQFVCPECKWESKFDSQFMDDYRNKWGFEKPYFK